MKLTDSLKWLFGREDELPDARFVTIPIVDGITDIPRASRKPIAYATMRLSEGEVLGIVDKSIVLGIGGPPNSGKSTFAASLVVELNAILKSLESRGGRWNALLSYRAQLETLDVATPVAPAVLVNLADRRVLQAYKSPWTPVMAADAVAHVQKVKRSEGPILIIADLPGKIDDITRTLATAVDFGCVVSNQWDDIDDWAKLFQSAMVPTIAEFVTSFEISLVTDIYPIFRGRMHASDRIAVGWDPVVKTFAEFLLFSLLPKHA